MEIKRRGNRKRGVRTKEPILKCVLTRYRVRIPGEAGHSHTALGPAPAPAPAPCFRVSSHFQPVCEPSPLESAKFPTGNFLYFEYR